MHKCKKRIIILIVFSTQKYSPEYHPVELRELLPLARETELLGGAVLRKFGLSEQFPSTTPRNSLPRRSALVSRGLVLHSM